METAMPSSQDRFPIVLVESFSSLPLALIWGEGWRARAQGTVNNALMRYFIVHAHRLIDPSADRESGLSQMMFRHFVLMSKTSHYTIFQAMGAIVPLTGSEPMWRSRWRFGVGDSFAPAV
jgi:hypothetical protein